MTTRTKEEYTQDILQAVQILNQAFYNNEIQELAISDDTKTISELGKLSAKLATLFASDGVVKLALKKRYTSSGATSCPGVSFSNRTAPRVVPTSYLISLPENEFSKDEVITAFGPMSSSKFIALWKSKGKNTEDIPEDAFSPEVKTTAISFK